MKRAAGVWILAHALTLVAAGQSSRQISEDKQWTIEGDVSTDAGPAARADIFVSGPPWRVSTDAKGHYVLKGTAFGTFIFSAEKEGAARSEPKAVTVFPGKRSDTIDFHLGKMSVISGRVLDANRKPIREASVCACVKLHRDGRMRLDFKQCAASDDLGQYRIADLRKGPYILEIGTPMLTPRKRLQAAIRDGPATKHVTIARTSFYPGVDSLDAAAPITLAQGMEYSGADIVLPQVDSFCVRAKVIPYSRETSAALWLNRAIGDSFPSIARGTVPSGEDSEICGVTPGQYWLEATTWNPDTNKTNGYIRTQVVVSNRDVDVETLSPTPGVDVQGKVSVTGESNDDSAPGNLSITLRRRGRPILYGEDLNALVRPDGAFTIRNVFPDQYGLSVSGLPDGYYLREAKQQGIDVTHGPVQPGNGELFISLNSGAAVISGTTVDKEDHPLPDAMVALIREKAADGYAILTQQSDQGGAFKFGGVAPGDYQLLALTGLLEGEAEDPAFVATQMSAAVELSAEPRSSHAVTLKVRSAH